MNVNEGKEKEDNIRTYLPTWTPRPIASRCGLPLGATSHRYQQHDGHGDRIDQTGR